jgi:hypothetical protein
MVVDGRAGLHILENEPELALGILQAVLSLTRTALRRHDAAAVRSLASEAMAAADAMASLKWVYF